MNEKRFDGLGKIYAKFRPSYPDDFIDYLYSNAGLTKDSVVADVGAGTGILTEQLLLKGSKVFAVEPNENMRNMAEENLHRFKGFISVSATAENTKLLDNSIDFITVAQAFHWFDKQAFKKECQRILKPNGKVILVWNSRDEKSQLIQLNEAINKKYCTDFKGFSGGISSVIENNAFDDFFTGEFEVCVFDNPLYFDEKGFIGRNLSSSYAPKEHDDMYDAYVSELKAVFEVYNKNGILMMPNFTRSYIGAV
nr:class I SAM-dependent methyltransferase [uncultured Cellulosilyticum sp.]